MKQIVYMNEIMGKAIDWCSRFVCHELEVVDTIKDSKVRVQRRSLQALALDS